MMNNSFDELGAVCEAGIVQLRETSPWADHGGTGRWKRRPFDLGKWRQRLGKGRRRAQ